MVARDNSKTRRKSHNNKKVMENDQEENSGRGGEKAIEAIAGGGMKKTILGLVMGANALTYFLIIFFGIVVIFSVFPDSAPASENDTTSSPTGLCVPLKATDLTSATAAYITNYSNNPTFIMHPGAFLNMATLPASGDYIKASNSMWGQPELISLLEGVASEWNKKHPEAKMTLNDLSGKAGGPLGGHASHQVGVDVDVSNHTSPSFLMSNKAVYNPSLAIELGKLFFDTKSIIFIFYNDSNVSNAVNDYASSKSLPGKMQFAKGHENHFHVRINKALYKDACGY